MALSYAILLDGGKIFFYDGNLSLLSFSSRVDRYRSGDWRKRYCMRRASWRWFNSLRKARHRVRSVGQSSGPEKGCRREATEATIRTGREPPPLVTPVCVQWLAVHES